jgi:S-formylglutathione hydrolase FrmB
MIFLLLGSVSCGRPSRQAATTQLVSSANAVTVTEVHFPSTAIGGLLWYRVIVPAAATAERFPVLYLLHGANSSPVEIMECSDVVKLAGEMHMIVVMPYAGNSYYTNAKHKAHARWEDAIAGELPRDVAARFPVLPGREHTGIAGISMGGYGAAKLAVKHPELYSFAGVMSGALDITRRPIRLRRLDQAWRIWSIFGLRPSARRDEDIFDLLDRAGNGGAGPQWFESCGERDPLRAVNQRLVKKLRERGTAVTGLTTAGGHDWQSWKPAIAELFTRAATRLQ